MGAKHHLPPLRFVQAMTRRLADLSTQLEPIQVFTTALHQAKRAHPDVYAVELIQHPGDTVYVPVS